MVYMADLANGCHGNDRSATRKALLVLSQHALDSRQRRMAANDRVWFPIPALDSDDDDDGPNPLVMPVDDFGSDSDSETMSKAGPEDLGAHNQRPYDAMMSSFPVATLAPGAFISPATAAKLPIGIGLGFSYREIDWVMQETMDKSQ